MTLALLDSRAIRNLSSFIRSAYSDKLPPGKKIFTPFIKCFAICHEPVNPKCSVSAIRNSDKEKRETTKNPKALSAMQWQKNGT